MPASTRMRRIVSMPFVEITANVQCGASAFTTSLMPGMSVGL